MLVLWIGRVKLKVRDAVRNCILLVDHFLPTVLALSSAIDPIAACTVAFGSQARAMKNLSLMLKPAPITTKNDIMTRTDREQARIAQPYPTVEGSSLLSCNKLGNAFEVI